MSGIGLTFQSATEDDFAYIYSLCELTMRGHVEADLGDCFERIARPTIERLIERRLFSKIYADDVLVGAVATDWHDTHIQLEEIYVEPARQGQGIGTAVVTGLVEQSMSRALPIRLHVLVSNNARDFYEKLGFSLTRSTKEVNFMEFTPPDISETGTP